MKYIFMILLSLVLNSQARLGETIEQCRERYGKETKADKDGDIVTAYFDKGKVMIAGKFLDLKCIDIAYVFPDDALKFIDRKPPHRLSPVIVRHLLNANGTEWVRVDWQGHHDNMKYISKDGTLGTFTRNLVSFSNADYAAKLAKIDHGKEHLDGL